MKLEQNGWKQVSEKVWVGRPMSRGMGGGLGLGPENRAFITIKTSKQTKRAMAVGHPVFNIRVNDVRSEGGSEDSLEAAYERVKWFMERHPQ